jgi:hypothetical protein
MPTLAMTLPIPDTAAHIATLMNKICQHRVDLEGEYRQDEEV